ncbi:methyltransferase domain-containing protein [Microlunatus sp. Gsoil 973]|nr:methyltransferase domain-containing protein [Microlunatus sp. Gsoil 973]
MYRQLITDRDATAGASVDLHRIFDHAYHGRSLEAKTVDGVDPLRIAADLWHRPADAVDRLVVARCQPPVLDLGCGPGRMVAALTESGRSALGVDVSSVAVGASNRRGAPTLRRDLSGPLPGEGRWGTVLLMDSNLGLGGDPDRLLRRCAALVAPGGLIICETDPEPYADETHRVLLRAGTASGRVRWARIGIEALAARARRHNLVVAERWSAGGRTCRAAHALATRR